ncbi:transcription elongation factor Spt5 [Rhodotorula sp. JG-1b]|nr:transcription elongation factor Spt5 [Rhodotorula sp. JG-1b]
MIVRGRNGSVRSLVFWTACPHLSLPETPLIRFGFPQRRRRGGAQFLDIEADVDEDEDEEEEEGEEGFVANGADDGDDADFAQGDFDGDASHRRLDRRRMAQKDKEAAELAAELNQRYRRNKYTTDGAEDWAPKAMLMPSEKDPRIWGIKCKTGRERDLILSISRKAVALEAADNGIPLAIISAFQRDSLKGFIYIEARSEQDVRTAVHGLVGLYMNGPNGIFLVDVEEMPDLLRTKQKRVDLQPGGWVRFKRGKYAGDLAQILAPSENGDEIAVKFIPRIDLAPKDDALGVGPDGRKRKKGATMPLAFRPPQRLFNAEEIAKIYGQKEVQKRGNVLIFKGDEYHDGFCEKDVRVSSLNVEDVTPTIDELTRFQGDAAAEAGGALDLSQIADAARTLSKTILQPGDHVDIFEGDQKGVYGTVDSVTNEVVVVTPHADLDLEGTKIEVPARSVRKRFKEGDHVKVMQGANADETGLVVKVEGDVVTFLSDLSSTEVSVFAKDVREAAEVGSGINVIAGYELHDLVQLDPQTAGVIIKMERDQFRVLDQTGSVRALKPNQLSGKVQTRFAVATDKDGFDIKPGENNNSGIERRGKVLHVYRSMFAFLHSRDITENGGVFVSYARNLESTAPRPNKPSGGMGMNPDRLNMMGGGPAVPKVQVATGVQMGRDHRINRRVAITRGTYKGNHGVIKDVTGNSARVELHSISKTVTVSIETLKERTDAGELIPLMDRPGGGGGATPAYAGAGAYGRTPHYAGGAAAAAPGMGATPNPYGAPSSSRTPYGAGFAGGKTPDPRHLAGGRTPAYGTGAGIASGGRTPAYGAKNGYAAASAPTPGGNLQGAAPTPAASGSGAAAWADDDWGDQTSVQQGAPTPAPGRDNGPDYNGAPTPYAGAPTPAAGGAPTPGAYLGAPTPGFSGAPTPSAYPSGPTPGASGSYGAAAQTPGGGAAGGYYQTPYAGAATNAAEPLEEREMMAAADAVAVPHPSEWVVENVKIVVKESAFQGGRLTGQHGKLN